MIEFLARDIQAFVMYCVNGTSRSSLLIESTDSMITVKACYISYLYTLLHVRTYVKLFEEGNYLKSCMLVGYLRLLCTQISSRSVHICTEAIDPLIPLDELC